jgi:hypothetical protein
MQKLMILLVSVFALWACEEQGPLERAGEEVDEAFEDIRSGGETMGNRLDDAVDEVREAGEEVADEVRPR